MNENKIEVGREMTVAELSQGAHEARQRGDAETADRLQGLLDRRMAAQNIGVDMGAPEGDRAGTAQDIMDAVKADIEARIGDVDQTAGVANYPVSLTLREVLAEDHAKTGTAWGGPEGVEPIFFRFAAGGPFYKQNMASEKLEAITDKDGEVAALQSYAKWIATDGGEAEDLIEEEFEEEQADDAGFEDDHDQDAYAEEAGYLATLDEIILPRIVTSEDLKAARLASGPNFTHAEALLAAMMAANSVCPDAPMDEDMAEALYEYAERQKWDGVLPETLYRQAMTLMETEAGHFPELDIDLRHWFLVFATVGKVMAVQARLSKAEYLGQLVGLQREIERTRSQQKLADRKAEKQKRREERPALLKRSVERWKKNQKIQARKAARARR